jgi:hypothetical protein
MCTKNGREDQSLRELSFYVVVNEEGKACLSPEYDGAGCNGIDMLGAVA